MSDDVAAAEGMGSGAAALAGYEYQIDVSIWLALDLMLSRKLTDRVTLEPTSEEDLEAILTDYEQGAVATRASIDGYLLVVQAKRREGDAWRVADLKRLLRHGGENRMSAAKRLQDPRVRYVLVTSAGLNGGTRNLKVRRAGASPRGPLPVDLARVLPPDAGGRVAVIGGLDDERLLIDIERLLIQALNVPYADWVACLRDLRDAARARMRGTSEGQWCRDDIAEIIGRHGGHLAADPRLERYVHPTNWSGLRARMRDDHAALIVGQSGTGKTEATRKLFEELLAENPGLKNVPIRGPEQLRDDRTPGPVLYDIEDPWGRVDFEPDRLPWNDQLAGFMSRATGQRMIIATTRSDVLHSSGAQAAMAGWQFQLEAEHYGPVEKSRLYRTRIDTLPHDVQVLAADNERRVLAQLATPLEIAKYFDAMRILFRNDPEGVYGHVSTAISRAHQDAIEATVAAQIRERGDIRAAAVLWGLLKADDRISLRDLPTIEEALAEQSEAFLQGIMPLVDVFGAARNLRIGKADAAYYHPRVEAGIEQALQGERLIARAALKLLITVLVSPASTNPDWGAGAAAKIVAAARMKFGPSFAPTDAAAARIDAWLAARLSEPGNTFERDLQLASAAGSECSRPSELARWLLHRPDERFGFFHRWGAPKRDEAWYAAMRGDPAVTAVCRRFVREMMPHGHDSYPTGFHAQLDRVADVLTEDFMAAALNIVHSGHITNSDAIAAGALLDPAGFEAVVDQAVAVRTPTDAERKRWSQQSLDIDNGVYSDDYAEHLASDDDGVAAGEMLDAYVAQVRRKTGWRFINQHRHAEILRQYWLRDLSRDAKESPDPEEVIGALGATGGTDDEDQFWYIARHAWDERFRAPLLSLLRGDALDTSVLHAALGCLIEVAPEELEPLAYQLEQDGRRDRLVEYVIALGRMSLKNRGPFEHERGADHGPSVATALASLPPAYASLVEASISLQAGEAPALPPESLAVVDAVKTGRSAVRDLKVALSAYFDLEVDDDIRWVLANTREERTAVAAMEAAIRRGMTADIHAAIGHRYARVTALAMKEIAAAMPTPLDARLLDLSGERSSYIKKALVAILADKPHQDHIAPLIRLAGDQWTPDMRHSDYEDDYPIAQAAVDALALQGPVSDEDLDRVYQIGLGASDPILSAKVLDLVASVSHGWRERLFELADAPGRGSVRRAAAQALLGVHDQVSPELAARITRETLALRAPIVASRFALLLAVSADRDDVLHVARATAGHVGRRVLLLLMIWALKDRDVELANEIAALLPSGHVGVALARGRVTEPIEEAAIANLGDAVICKEALRWINPASTVAT
ncbi:nSTAND3 domain-containing NTPase [Brevundimonas sp.]